MIMLQTYMLLNTYKVANKLVVAYIYRLLGKFVTMDT